MFHVVQSLPYLTLPYLTLPYLTLPYLTLPYLTLPYLTLPYLTLPYLTLPYLTLPYLTLPYLTLPYRSVVSCARLTTSSCHLFISSAALFMLLSHCGEYPCECKNIYSRQIRQKVANIRRMGLRMQFATNRNDRKMIARHS